MESAIVQSESNCNRKNMGRLYYGEILNEPGALLHSGQDCVTVIAVHGMVEVEFDKEVQVLTENNVLLLKHGTLSFRRSIRKGSSICALHMRPEIVNDYLKTQMSDCRIFYDFLRLQPIKTEYLLFDITFEPVVQLYLKLLFYEATRTIEEKEKNEKKVRCAFILFLTNLHQEYQKNLLISGSSMMEDYEIGRILKYIADHYATVTLSSVAEEFNFHPAYFSARFKRLAECSFSEKLLQIRLEQARRLLASSELPVQKIVEEIGFTEKSYFYKRFKMHYQMTPMQYRRVNRKKGDTLARNAAVSPYKKVIE